MSTATVVTLSGIVAFIGGVSWWVALLATRQEQRRVVRARLGLLVRKGTRNG